MNAKGANKGEGSEEREKSRPGHAFAVSDCFDVANLQGHGWLFSRFFVSFALSFAFFASILLT